MQSKTGFPREHLTTAQVDELLTGQDVERGHGAELLDDDNRVIEDLGEDVGPWTVTYSSGGGEEVHGSLSIPLTRELDWGRVRVRPYMTLSRWERYRELVTVIDRPAASVSRVTDSDAEWSQGTLTDVEPRDGALQLTEGIGSPEYAAAVMADSPVGYWRLGEASGTTVVDETGANHGTYSGGVTLGTAGALTGDSDTAATFDGVSGEGTLGNPAAFQFTSGALEAWVKCTTPGTDWRGVLGKPYAYSFLVRSGILSTWDWNTNTEHSTGIRVDDGQWHHVVMDIQSGVANGCTLYLDGAAVLSFTITVANQNNTLQIGRDGTTHYLNGSIDEAAIYNAPLGLSRVQAHYAAGTTTPAPAYPTSGSRVSPALSLSPLAAVDSSSVLWSADVPAGASLTVETSVDNGATWQAVTSGDPIPAVTPGADVLTRLTLAGDGATTPTVSSLTVSASQTELSHNEIQSGERELAAKFYAGVYVLTTPETRHGREPVRYDVLGKNLLYLLDRNVGETYVVTAGTTYLQALRDTVTAAGLSIPVRLDGTRQDATLPEDRVWCVGDTRWLDVCNDILAEIAYTDLYLSEVGDFRSQPIIPTEQRPVEWTFDTADQFTDLVDAEYVETQEKHGRYNRWRFVRAQMAYQPFEGDGLFTYGPPAGTPTAEVRSAPLQVIDAADQAALEAEGLRIVAADQRTERMFAGMVDPLPLAGHRDVVAFVSAGRSFKMQVTSWGLTPYGKSQWVIGGGTGGGVPERPERSAQATVTQSNPLRVVVDGAAVDSPAKTLDAASYTIGERVTVTVRNPRPPLVQGAET